MAVFGANGDNVIHVTLAGNFGNGEAQRIELVKPVTLEKFFSDQFPGQAPKNFNVFVNGAGVASDYLLQNGDLVTVTNTNVQAG